jgi:hypothetical protein
MPPDRQKSASHELSIIIQKLSGDWIANVELKFKTKVQAFFERVKGEFFSSILISSGYFTHYPSSNI